MLPRTCFPLPLTLLTVWMFALLCPAAGARGDGPCQMQRLVSPNWARNAFFGDAIATDGEALVVTAPGANSAGTNTGEAYVFRRAARGWRFEQLLVPSSGDGFGSDAAIDGDVILIGAAGADDMGSLSGAAHIFRHDGSQWIEEQRMLPPPQSEGFAFGASVALQGDLAVVGAPVLPYPPDEPGFVFVYQYNGSFWSFAHLIQAPDPGADQQFGHAVATDGARIVVGAHWSDVAATPGGGAAYVFQASNGFALEKRLVPSSLQGFDEFGYDVAIDGDRLAIGAPRPWHGLGSVYTFELHGTSNWVQTQRLEPATGGTNEMFGSWLALSGPNLLVGAPQTFTSGQGRTYAYALEGASWNLLSELLPAPPAGPRATFGAGLALAGDQAFASARYADPGCEADVNCNSGAVYVFSLSGAGCLQLVTPRR